MPNKPRFLSYTSLCGIQNDFAGFREIAAKGRPVLVMDNDERVDVAVFLPHKAAESVERLLRKRTGKLSKHFSSEGFEPPNSFEPVVKALEEDGMARLGNETTGIYWNGLLAIEHLDLVFEARPDWKEAFDWEDLGTK